MRRLRPFAFAFLLLDTLAAGFVVARAVPAAPAPEPAVYHVTLPDGRCGQMRAGDGGRWTYDGLASEAACPGQPVTLAMY